MNYFGFLKIVLIKEIRCRFYLFLTWFSKKFCKGFVNIKSKRLKSIV
jgi:hypothetical protein